jgi:hypothetical protein
VGWASLRLITQQFAASSVAPIKAAASAGNIYQQSRRLSATLAMADALAAPQLLPGKQNQKCSQFKQRMISFWSGCTDGVHGRYRFQ